MTQSLLTQSLLTHSWTVNSLTILYPLTMSRLLTQHVTLRLTLTLTLIQHVSSGMVNTETGQQLQLTGRDAKDNSNNIDHQAEGKQSANESKEDHHHHHHHHLGPHNNSSNNNLENEFLESGDEGLAGRVGLKQLTSYYIRLYHFNTPY